MAEEFVKGDEGSLFFIQCSAGRPISKFSKFPDEAEVLFRPNTVFTITSTLYGTSEIGQFYSGIDNIAMVCAPVCHPWACPPHKRRGRQFPQYCSRRVPLGESDAVWGAWD